MDRETIEKCAAAIRKARRTKVVGPELATPRQRRDWDQTRYETLREAERALLALLD